MKAKNFILYRVGRLRLCKFVIMEIKILKEKVANAEQFIRRCGYGKIFDRQTGQTSFVRRLHGDFYPRFHVYVNDGGQDWIFNLHLDQKRPSYEGSHAHSGEYDGALVAKEAERIRKLEA